MNAVIIACLALGWPMGVCRADADFLPTPPVEPPEWATERWIEWAAHIVSSEAGNAVPQARIVVSCTMVRDVEDRGWPPWSLRNRWFGWGRPSAADVQAVRRAVNGGCDDVKQYAFVGNIDDGKTWKRMGLIGEEAVDLFIGPTGSTVIGVP